MKKNYSLWLMTEEDISDKVYSLIKQLAKDYSGPVFEPHITLLPDIVLSEEEIIEKTSKLASDEHSFLIEVEKIDYQNTYFRNLFIKLKLNDELLNLHNEANQIFEIDNDQVYMPHISILYGNHSKETKEEIVELKRKKILHCG